MRPLVVAFALLFFNISIASTSAWANYNRSGAWFNSLSTWERQGIQLNLMLPGFYSGFADATFGSNTYEALRRFESANRFWSDGVLTRREAQRLIDLSQRWQERLGLENERDLRTGISLPIPKRLVNESIETEFGRKWRSSSNDLSLDTFAYLTSHVSLELLYATLSDGNILKGVEYKRLLDDIFVITGENEGVRYYFHAKINNRYISAFSVSWVGEKDDIPARIAIYIASRANYFQPTNPPSYDSGGSNAYIGRSTQVTPPVQSTGSGFFVSTTGLILTNHHVVDGCATLEVPGHGTADVLRIDQAVDLAAILVRTPAIGQATAILADSNPSLGSSVVVGGYPLAEILGSNFTVSFGEVTARRGVGGDRSAFAVSAALQPGNSGGPVVNTDGNVIGIAVRKLNDAKMIEVAETTGANFGFAVSSQLAIEFLRPFLIVERNDLVNMQRRTAPLSKTQISENIESYSVQIICNP